MRKVMSSACGHSSLFGLLVLLVLLTFGCGSSGGGGGSTPAPAQGPMPDLTGRWKIEEVITQGGCDGDPVRETWFAEVSHKASDESQLIFDVIEAGGNYTGDITGIHEGNKDVWTISLTGSFAADGGTTTVTDFTATIEVNVSTNDLSFEGTAKWSWTNGNKTCSGTTKVTGLRVTVPEAAFSASATEGIDPVTVEFTDESTEGSAPITSWEWDFDGDGEIDSTDADPTFTYHSPGVFSVALTITTDHGTDTVTIESMITVEARPPEAAFSASPTEGVVPLTVQFTDESVQGSGEITEIKWDFTGDGVYESFGVSDPIFKYNEPGDYTVTLTISTEYGTDTETFHGMIHVENLVIPLSEEVSMEMVYCPPGTFRMGRTPDEQDSETREDARHEVRLSSGFYIGRYEVTKEQWETVMGTSPWSGEDYVLDTPASPAVWISFNDAGGFIAALNALDPSQGVFRLPTEAQWEYACRAGAQTRFYWGDDVEYTEINDHVWYKVNADDAGERYAHEVGRKQPNSWGLYDMSGNVYEWCQDWFGGQYGSENIIDPIGPESGFSRILRGGSWSVDARKCRSAHRYDADPDQSDYDFGFRVVRLLSSETKRDRS